MAADIQSTMKDLLFHHSALYCWNTPDGPVAVISVNGNNAYQDLDQAGRRIQSKVLEDYRHFSHIVRALLHNQPNDILETLDQTDKVILAAIEQTGSTWRDTNSL